MFQVLKSPRDTEESRIKDLASHIHRSQFRFSNSVCSLNFERLIFVFTAVSWAALKNKPRRFIRQVIVSKYFFDWHHARFSRAEMLRVGRGFSTYPANGAISTPLKRKNPDRFSPVHSSTTSMCCKPATLCGESRTLPIKSQTFPL